MQNKHTSSKRLPLYRRPWIWAFVGIIAVVLVIISIVLSKQNETALISTEPETSQTESTDEQTDTTSVLSEPEDKAIQYEGEDPNKLPELTGVITMKDVSGGILTVMSSVDQYLEGICVITLRNANAEEVYKASSDLKPDITTSYCEPFAISINNLPSGRYQIELELSGDNKTGLISDEVNL